MGRHTGEYDDEPMDAVRERWAREASGDGVRLTHAASAPARRPSAPLRPPSMPGPGSSRSVRGSVPAAASAAPMRAGVASRAKQAATVVFAFAASVSFLLVNIVDPYSGATASSSYQAADRFGGQSVQAVEVDGGYSVSVASEGYLVEKYVEPEPEPAAGAGFAPPAVVPDPGSAQAYAAGAVAARGWPSSEFDCLVALWNKESGWRVNAMNPSSGAYGIPQALPGSKMATAGDDWATNAATQIEWGLGYITDRYGTPCGAWGHSQSVGWY